MVTFEALMRVVTHLGNFLLWFFISLILYWLRGRGFANFFTASVLFGYALNTTLKYSLRLPRPPSGEWLIEVEDPYGFPSGHASTVFLVVTLLTLKDRRFTPLYSLAVLVAYSRVLLGVHYPVDVIGGAAIGVTVAVAAQLLRTRLRVNGKFLLFYLWLMIGLLLLFLTGPTLISGLTLGFAFSTVVSVKREVKGVMGASLGASSTLLVLVAYNLFDVPAVRLFAAFMLTFWPLNLYPYVYAKVAEAVLKRRFTLRNAF